MSKLEDLKQNARVKGLSASGTVTVIYAKWHGSDVVELTYRDQNGQPHTELLYRDREADLEVIDAGILWAFDADRFEGCYREGVNESHAKLGWDIESRVPGTGKLRFIEVKG